MLGGVKRYRRGLFIKVKKTLLSLGNTFLYPVIFSNNYNSSRSLQAFYKQHKWCKASRQKYSQVLWLFGFFSCLLSTKPINFGGFFPPLIYFISKRCDPLSGWLWCTQNGSYHYLQQDPILANQQRRCGQKGVLLQAAQCGMQPCETKCTFRCWQIAGQRGKLCIAEFGSGREESVL